MITGVQTILLAVLTALPFTPPAGWVQLPQSMVGARVSNVWKGPKTGSGTAPSFSAMAFPYPGTAQMLASGGAKAAARTNVLKTLSNAAVNLCGTSGQLVTTRVSEGTAQGVLLQEIAVKNGYAYMLMYTRPASAPADPRILAAMRSFCPSGTTAMPDFAMPAGWTKSNLQLQVAGAWMGTQPGEVITLMRGTQMGSLNQLFNSAQNRSLTAKSGKSLLKVTQQKRVMMCGYPGMLVDMNVNATQMPVAMHMALTQGNGSSYVLMYVQMGTAQTDPRAIAALQTLCAAGPSPRPSATPPAAR